MGIILTKNRVQSIHLRKLHVARPGDALAKDTIEDGRRFRIYHEDGRLRMLVDFSNRVPEAEWVHPRTSEDDAKICEKHYKDWMENDPPTNSELEAKMNKIVEYNIDTAKSAREAATGLNVLVKLAQPKKEEELSQLKKLDCYDQMMYG